MSSLPSPAEPLLLDIRRVLAPLGRRFADAGRSLYLVGGVVRDNLLGLTASPDVDLTTDAEPQEVLGLVGPFADDLWRQGERFGTIGLRSAGLGNLDLEITTYRAEHYDPTSRKPLVHFGSDIFVDLERRDFTINAMAISVIDGTLVDPFGGRNDLEKRILRTPGPAEESFTDDPLRLLRAARFLARFGLTADRELDLAADAHSHRLAIVSIERIRGEIDRLLGLDQPSTGLMFLRRHRLLDRIRPDGELPDAIMARVTATGDPLLRRAALWSDIQPDALAGHLRMLKFSVTEQHQTLVLVEAARTILELAGAESDFDGRLRRLVHRIADEPAGTDRAVILARLIAALPIAPGSTTPTLDTAAFDAAALDPVALDAVEKRLAELRRDEDLTSLVPPIQGGELIQELDLQPGPLVGRLVNALFQLRLDRGPLGRDELLAEARRLLP